MTTSEQLLQSLRRSTRLQGFQVILSARAAALYIATDGEVPDSRLTVDFFRAIDPEVNWIEVWIGDEPAVGYRLSAAGRWTVETPDSHIAEAA